MSKTRLIVCGDTHGENVRMFSYKNHPEFKNLDENDVVVVLGDTAIGWPGIDDVTKNTFEHVAKKPFTVIYMFGNHDNYDWSRELFLSEEEDRKKHNISGPYCWELKQVEWDGKIYENQFVCDHPMIADIGDYHCLLIPGADSHDIDEIYFPEEKSAQKTAERQGKLCRTIGKTWWGGEVINIVALQNLVNEEVRKNEFFDLVLTHDCPASFLNMARNLGGAGDYMKPTVGEKYLEALHRTLNYGSWFHGHMHYDFFPYYNFNMPDHNYYDTCCLYNVPFEVEELEEILQKQYKKKFIS